MLQENGESRGVIQSRDVIQSRGERDDDTETKTECAGRGRDKDRRRRLRLQLVRLREMTGQVDRYDWHRGHGFQLIVFMVPAHHFQFIISSSSFQRTWTLSHFLHRVQTPRAYVSPPKYAMPAFSGPRVFRATILHQFWGHSEFIPHSVTNCFQMEKYERKIERNKFF